MGISMGISIIWDFSMGFARILWEYLWEYLSYGTFLWDLLGFYGNIGLLGFYGNIYGNIYHMGLFYGIC